MSAFNAPRSGTLEQPFEARHWDVTEAMLRDPDGRLVSVQAPVSSGAKPPDGDR